MVWMAPRVDVGAPCQTLTRACCFRLLENGLGYCNIDVDNLDLHAQLWNRTRRDLPVCGQEQ
jgi:hypothetical protein